jgi:hypothetical protein
MSRARRCRRFIDAFVERARWVSHPRLYLAIVTFHLIVLSSTGYGACAVGDVWKVVERYREARSDALRARERREEFKSIVSRLEKFQRTHGADDSRRGDDAMAHSIVRESAEKQGLQLKGFVATEEEGTHLVTLEGAFANVVMWTAALPQDFESFYGRRFTARSLSSRGETLEVEFLIKKSPNAPELSPLCNTELR